MYCDIGEPLESIQALISTVMSVLDTESRAGRVYGLDGLEAASTNVLSE